MGIKNILPHLPGGSTSQTKYSFYDCALNDQSVVPIDAAGLIWQCANRNSVDYLRGNYLPALSDFTKLLNNLRSICGWNMILYMDGRSNPYKAFEDARRKEKASASAQDDTRSVRCQIRNTPESIARAVNVCKFMDIRVVVSAYEADGQVVKHTLSSKLLAITGDSDLLAIGCEHDPKLDHLMVVTSWESESFRIIDLTLPSTNGELPLVYDLYVKHGRIIFQLYAGCTGCDFTEQESGFPSIGFATFIDLMGKVDGPPSVTSFAAVVWAEYKEKAQRAFSSPQKKKLWSTSLGLLRLTLCRKSTMMSVTSLLLMAGLINSPPITSSYTDLATTTAELHSLSLLKRQTSSRAWTAHSCS